MMKYFGLPVLASKHGADVDRMVIYLHLIMALLFIGWGVYFVYALWRFSETRVKNADYVGARTHASTYVEVAVAVARSKQNRHVGSPRVARPARRLVAHGRARQQPDDFVADQVRTGAHVFARDKGDDVALVRLSVA